MNGIIAWFARNGVAANLLMFAILAGGIWATSNKIILQEYPDRTYPYITVSVTYRGSTPGEIEQAIVTRLEEALYDIEGIKEMTGRASASAGSVMLEISEGYSLSEKLDEVTNRVSTIRTFPPEAERPQISLFSRSERVITMVLSGELSEKELTKLGEQIRDEVSNIPGITLAGLKAVRPYEIAIEISESTLQQYGLTFDQVTRAIRSSSVDLSAGSVKTDTGRILLRTNQQAYNREDFASITLLTRSDGTKLQLGDLATVIDGFDETPIVSKYNGERAIAIDVFRSGLQNIIKIGDDVKEFLAIKQQQLPEGIKLSYWGDDSEKIKVRLNTLMDSAIMGFILVVIILSLFLRPTLAFWVAWGIPIAFAGTFLVLPFLGMSLNVITLMAFIMTLGIVVDDAIVTGENVFQRMQRGEKPLTASIKGTQEVAVPVIFGVITTMVAFFPIMMQSGVLGTIYSNIPKVVIPVLFFSLIESKLILPAHLKHCTHLADKTSKQNFFSRLQRFFADGLERFILKYYRPVLNWALINRYISTSVFIGFLLIFVALVLGERIGYRRYATTAQDTTNITLKMPAGTTFEVTQKKVDLIESVALKLKKDVNERFGTTVIQNVFATSGGHPFGNSYSRAGELTVGQAESGEVIIELTPSETRDANYGSRDLVSEMRQLVPPIPEAEQLSFSFERWNSGSAITIELSHPNVEMLKEASADLQRKLASFEGLFDITDSYEKANEEYELDLKPEAEYLGVTATNLAQQVRTAFFGSEAQRIQRGRDEIRVMVRYPESERRSLGSLQAMMIRTANGTEVPFETVATIVPGKSLPSIQRVDRKRVIQVSADGDTTELDIESMETEILEEYLPELVATKYPGLHFGVRGFSAVARDNQREMIVGIYFILAVIYALLAIPFRSYFQPIIVMSAIPFGVVGAIMGHYIMAKVFGFNGGDPIITQRSIFGMMALSGVVVNDSLVMVHFMNARLKEGMPLNEAVRLAGVKRFRPILLTSLTTFFGLAPLMFETSPQAVDLVPMVISLAWGIVFATAITLILIPVLVLVYNDIQKVFYKLYNIDPIDRGDEGDEILVKS
ncbi:MAG: efflux RND transporter permease subunit [Verrucomicrobia bacterium]|nr:efflux RND transporter permease subunit [Verrucomicrobiota bacterium]